MSLVCPKCNSEIGIDDVDMVNETAFCGDCQSDFDCKDWIETSLVTPRHLENPPDGAFYERTFRGFRVTASTRSYRWIIYLPMACAWSALLGFFSWGLSHVERSEGLPFHFLFLIPFYGMAAGLWLGVLFPIFGNVAVNVDGDTGTIFKGIGRIGRRRNFDWGAVEKVRLSNYYVTNWPTQEQIWLDGDETVLLARGVRHDRLLYLLRVLRFHHQKHQHARTTVA